MGEKRKILRTKILLFSGSNYFSVVVHDIFIFVFVRGWQENL